MIFVTGYTLMKALTEAGYPLPPETCGASIDILIDGLAQLNLKINLTSEDLIKVAAALKETAEEALRIDAEGSTGFSDGR